MWAGVGWQGKTASQRWREYRNAFQYGKGVYVSMKINTFWLVLWEFSLTTLPVLIGLR